MKNFIKNLKNFRFKGTVILFFIFIILLTFVLVFEKKRPTKTDEEALDQNREIFTVWELNKDEIEKIDILYNNKNFEIERKGDKWQVLKPRQFEAENEKINKLLEKLAKLEGEKKITPENLKDFGLDKPKIKAKITLKHKKQFEISIGNENPEGTKFYAKRGDENYVFMIEPTFKENLNIKEKDLEKNKNKNKK